MSISRVLWFIAVLAAAALVPDVALAAGWQDVVHKVDPRVFYLLVSGAVFGVIWLWRRISIASWDAVTRGRPMIQQLPALVLSALMSAAPAVGKDFWSVVSDTILGVVFSGGGAILAHHLLKAAPVPYQGGKPPAAPPLAPGGQP